ncbi:hypothetical protein N7468_001460 [Penicillium chermesinum]|uniref:Uncharacterized protein n=1 Tax=Penicillium chermesinum TaxID=63820 RepID=A0A9W9PJM1_9EURO|nr:uncharacterized protein N7468_001460 [Penicillium chermesinum]KAJ5246477.1 hypothetical protein N7468_001460 [Penicillium chermesinum]KAJ6144749.1 hypothetical protein N7470_008644 [Penicillium chermesinum]
MVYLRKLFQDRGSSRPTTRPGSTVEQESSMRELYTRDSYGGHLSPGPPSPATPSASRRISRALDASHHFEDIERQFEDLHEHLAARPQTSQSYLPMEKELPQLPSRPKLRHIDLMEAILAPDRSPEPSHQLQPPPTSPYNEDVAERNMTRFLRLQYRAGTKSAGILPNFYQEDVADRNIAQNSKRSMSSLSLRSSPAAPGRVRNLSRDSRKHPSKPNWTSESDLRNRSEAARGSWVPQKRGPVRAQRSEPTLSTVKANKSPGSSSLRLGVPSEHRQGSSWSRTPLPDSPTLPVHVNGSGSPVAQSPVPLTARKSSLNSKPRSPSASSGSVSRKNVRDLSINTQLAATGRPKMTHKAIQPPTPSTVDLKRAPSIAEVLNSPLPAPTPTDPTPSPRFKASEMMELFTKAYMSTQSMSPHPTYETLQDAIVREINSHEAFQHVPISATKGPLFTPSHTTTFDETEKEKLDRNASAKQTTKIRTKGSFKRPKRNSESGRSISSIVPSKSYDKIIRRVASSPRHRRHTDAPAPSPSLVADSQTPLPAASKPNKGQPLTYMDVLARASSTNKTTNSRQRGNSESASNSVLPSRTTKAEAAVPSRRVSGTVYSMQAHSTPSKDSKSSLSIDESDDDIIHLPSVGVTPPRVQIEGVDLNNVHYMVEASTPTEAQKLMNWPQRERSGNHPPQRLGPIARARMQLRGTRSVETY